MKLRVLLMAAVLGLGASAVAQVRDTTPAPGRGERAAEKAPPRDAAGRAWDATRRAANRGADTLRRTGQAIERRLPGTPQQQAERAPARGQDARTVAAAPPESDTARRGRMDEAYDSWKRQQGSR